MAVADKDGEAVGGDLGTGRRSRLVERGFMNFLYTAVVPTGVLSFVLFVVALFVRGRCLRASCVAFLRDGLMAVKVCFDKGLVVI